SVLYWLFGSFSSLNWQKTAIIILGVAILTSIMLLFAKELNVILLGDEQAQQLGMNVKSFKTGMFVLVSALAAVCVAFTGIIGFVGLIIPHMIRMLFGADHRLLFPASALFGGAYLMAADTVARILVSSTELPVGVVTALCGAPYFIYLLRRKGGF
ncbi:MAG TPA: iron ABC transporter permease, partial [Syntrophales bacterium]|nr:iron ABC transporter permease [Syntrophales bacterium]